MINTFIVFFSPSFLVCMCRLVTFHWSLSTCSRSLCTVTLHPAPAVLACCSSSFDFSQMAFAVFVKQDTRQTNKQTNKNRLESVKWDTIYYIQFIFGSSKNGSSILEFTFLQSAETKHDANCFTGSMDTTVLSKVMVLLYTFISNWRR